MKTTNESYQNLTQTTNLQNLTYSELKNLYSTVYDSLGEAIDNDDIESHDKILSSLRAIKIEIHNRNKVTSTTTTNNQKIQIIFQEITNLYSKNNRSFLLESFNTFLFDRKRISFKKYLNCTDKLMLKRESNREIVSSLEEDYRLLKAS